MQYVVGMGKEGPEDTECSHLHGQIEQTKVPAHPSDGNLGMKWASMSQNAAKIPSRRRDFLIVIYMLYFFHSKPSITSITAGLRFRQASLYIAPSRA
jgi:hypothetical protein